MDLAAQATAVKVPVAGKEAVRTSSEKEESSEYAPVPKKASKKKKKGIRKPRGKAKSC